MKMEVPEHLKSFKMMTTDNMENDNNEDNMSKELK